MVMYIIPLLVLIVAVLVFYGESGMWEDLKETVLGVTDYVDFEVGLEELDGGEVVVSDNQKLFVSRLVDVIGQMRDANKTCFSQVSVSVPDFGEEGMSLSLKVDDSGNGSQLIVGGGAGGKQIVTSLSQEIHGVSPCVIAGDLREAPNFFSYYISQSSSALIEPNYRNVRGLDIRFSDGGTFGNSGNKIEIPEFGNSFVNDENDNFENEGWLYTPGNGVICFFPTNYVTDASEDGIGNEWFDLGEKDSIANRAKNGDSKVVLC
ncbi:hypothetical protein HOC01_02575 [archaeon]|nr:hypothetical protein [archaeon]MBT6697796.1 hypothetical protein [archaeon]